MRAAEAYAALDRAVPLALLPVRLETRYFTFEGADVLGVRIYPDTIHADDHTVGVTERELAAGHRYWEWIWWDRAETTVTEARRWLAAQVGPYRATHVASVLAPTNLDPDGGAPGEDPVFPRVTPVAQHEPVVARLLPDVWQLRIYDGAGQLVIEDDWELPDPEVVMAPSLRAGADIGAEDPRGAVRGFLDDQDLRWTIDFRSALDRGMARTYPHRKLPDRISLLLVTGVRVGRQPVAESDGLFEQFDRHRCTRGFDLVPQGTPTNNSDAGRSGVSIDDPDVDRLFAEAGRPGPGLTRVVAEALVRDPASLYLARNADALSLALGRPATNAADRTRHARWAEGTAAWAMNVGVGYATIGGLLAGPLLRSGGQPSIDPTTAAELRSWYSRWVRGGAVLPTIRCGEQPYGMLPIASRPAPSRQRGFRSRLASVLVDALEAWRDKLPVPTLDPDATDGRPSSTPDQAVSDVAAVLGAVPHPTSLQLRTAYDYGPYDALRLHSRLDDIDSYLNDPDPSNTPYAVKLVALTACRAVWEPLRDRMDSRKRRGVTIDEQLAAMEEFGAALSGLEQTYGDQIPAQLGNVRHAYDHQLSVLVRETLAGTEALTPLLDPLHTRGGIGANRRLRLASVVFSSSALAVEALVSDGSDAPLNSLFWWYRQMNREATDLAATGDWQQRASHADRAPLLVHLLDLSYQAAPVDQVPVVRLAFAIIDALYWLSDPVLHRDEQQTPDTDRVEGEDRPTATTGVVTNPYGGEVWTTKQVVDLLERLLRESLGIAMYRLDAWAQSLANEQFAAVRKARPRGLHVGAYGWLVDVEPSDEPASQGFVHAPSLNHATTAAVLRAGWSAFGTAASDAPLSVDLSSARVRAGQWILDGLRNGQDLAELLGARFERLLHDRRLDARIDEVRTIVLAATGGSGPAIDIVDGLVVARAFASAADRTTREQAVRTELNQARAAATGELRRAWDGVFAAARAVNADLDAVADVVMFQSVHSLLHGDDASAGAAVAISSGADASIPPITATASPRDGQRIIHRIAALFDPTVAPAGATVLGAASPDVVDWLRANLPAAANVQMAWTTHDGRTVRLDLAAIDLDVVDAMVLAGETAVQTDTDLGRVVTSLAAAKHGPGTLDPARAQQRADVLSLDEFGLLAARWRDALGRARRLHAADTVRPAESADGDRYELGTLEVRANAVIDGLQSLADDVGSSDASTRHRGLVGAAALGIPGALVALEADVAAVTSADEPPATDHPSMLAAVAARTATLTPAAGTSRSGGAGDADTLADALTAAIGGRLPVTAPFASPVAVTPSQKAYDLAVAVGEQAPTWLRQVGRVRTATGALVEAMLLTSAAGAVAPRLAALQTPSAQAPWVATSMPSSPGDQLSLLSVTGLDAAHGSLCGLLFDAWSETIPRTDQATAIAVHHDAPSARPPQAVLLATVGAGEERFTPELVAEQLRYTLELAKLRALGPIDLELGQILPAVYLPGGMRTLDDQRASEVAT